MILTWRIIPVSTWLVTPIYKAFRPFGRGATLLRGLTNHGYQPLTSPGMILQVGGKVNRSRCRDHLGSLQNRWDVILDGLLKSVMMDGEWPRDHRIPPGTARRRRRWRSDSLNFWGPWP